MKTLRWVLILVLLLIALLMGLILGTFNNNDVTIDFLLTSLSMKLGSVIVITLFSGLLLGALLSLVGAALPLYSRLRAANKQLAGRSKAAVQADSVGAATGPSHDI